MKNIFISACIIALVQTNAMPLYAHNATDAYDAVLRQSALITSVQIQSNLQSLKDKDFLTSVSLEDIKRDVDFLNQINTTLQLNSLESHHHSNNPCSVFQDDLNNY
ncbi:MAG: hypothetical protein HYY52_06790 [Candidatus Melainabacteria bacterium]|nr:hypothetical protein [Candidatus Melainabacteria bacterium]